MPFFEGFSFDEIGRCFMILFAVIDILGSIPLFVNLRKQFGQIEAGKATIASGIIMITFLFLGKSMLSFIGIDINSFAVAGSIVIFIIALEMILGVQIHKVDKSSSASIVPIAFPIVAGAGTLTAVLSLRAQYHLINIIIAILLNVIIVYFVLKSAKYIEEKIGDGTLMILKKAFGIILLAIAIKMFSSNISQLFESFSK